MTPPDQVHLRAGSTDLAAIVRELRQTKLRLSNHTNLNRLLVNALVASHPAPAVLARAIDHEKEKILAQALPQEKMTDSQIDYITKNVERIVADLQGRKRQR